MRIHTVPEALSVLRVKWDSNYIRQYSNTKCEVLKGQGRQRILVVLGYSWFWGNNSSEAGVFWEKHDTRDMSWCNDALIVILKYFNIMFVHIKHLFIMVTWDFTSENKMRQATVSHIQPLPIVLPCASALTLLRFFSVYTRETLKWSNQKGHFLMVRK